jgi:hypothetical protein
MVVLRRFVYIAFALSLGLGPAAQASPSPPRPAPGADPAGVVLDEQLRPIAGAKVSLQWETGGDAPFRRAIAARLQQVPLPATVSGRDGGWVLPLTNEQRQMGDFGFHASGCWLVVEKDGHHAWREPIPGGLPGYLGSRVLLRAVRADDGFAAVPWPPAIVSLRTRLGMAPWLPAGEPFAPTDRRGGAAAGEGPVPVEPDQLATIDVRVTSNGAALAHAQLWFDDGAFARPVAQPPLPFAVDAAGRASVKVPAGARRLRATAPGVVPREVAIEVAPGATGLCALDLLPARSVDLLAMSVDGVALPFVRLDAVHGGVGEPERTAAVSWSDSLGRCRMFFARPQEWFSYGDSLDVGGAAVRVPLDGRPAADGWIHVPKWRPVTVLLRGGEWPRHGTFHWEQRVGLAIGRGFQDADADAPAVVLHMCYRELVQTAIGGDGRPPIRIRAEDLPPAPAEPLLDLVALDRSVRVRAELVLPESVGSGRGFFVRPPWQAHGVRVASEAAQFAAQRDGKWVLLARDDGPLELVATAPRHGAFRFSVPASVAGQPLPRIEIVLTKL